MTINQSFQNWTIITDEPGEELVFEHEDPDTGQKDRFVLTEEAGLGSKMDPIEAYVDRNGFRFQATLSPPMKFSGPTFDTIGNQALTPLSQIVDLDSGHAGLTLFKARNKIVAVQPNGTKQELGELDNTATANTSTDTYGFVEGGARAVDDKIYLIAGDDGANQFNAYRFNSGADITSGTDNASLEDTYPPLPGGITSFFDGSTRGIVYGEYLNLDPTTEPDLRVIRNTGGSFNTVLTVSRDNYDHFHSLNQDWHNPGDMYLTSGDTGSEIQWWKSTDYGATWSQLSGVGGSQRFRTLTVIGTENYLWWASDGETESGFSELLRAPRNDLQNPETVAQLSATEYSFGISRVWNPSGLLVTLRENGDDTPTEIPQFFYDFETDQLVEIFRLGVDTGLNSRPGVAATMPYQDMNTGDCYVTASGEPNIQGVGTVAHSIDFSTLPSQAVTNTNSY